MAGAGQHFQGTHDALAVIGMDAGRVGGIFGGQFGMEGRRALLGQPGREGGGDGRIDGRYLGDAVQQALEVQAGAAHQQGHMAPGQHGLCLGHGLVGPAAGADLLLRGQKTVQMMRAAGLFLGRGLGRDEREIAVDLAGVGVDDLAVQGFGQGQGRGGLAAARGAGQTDDGQGRGHLIC